MSTDKPSLAKAMQTKFAPVLRGDGFLGSGQRYWRVINEQAQVLEAQVSSSGGKFAVNLGLQPVLVPLRSGDFSKPKSLRATDCLFRRRLAHENADQWWEYAPDQSSIDEAVKQACHVYVQLGRQQLNSVAAPASHLNAVSAEAFAAGHFDFQGFGNTKILMVWSLAQMRKAAGHNAEAVKFAQLALEYIGDGAAGRSLRTDILDFLERL
jgi:hypothetical protein